MNFNYLNVDDSILIANFSGSYFTYKVGKVVHVTKTQIKVETNVIREMKPMVYTFKRSNGYQILDASNLHHLEPMSERAVLDQKIKDLNDRRDEQRRARNEERDKAEAERRDQIRELKQRVGTGIERVLSRNGLHVVDVESRNGKKIRAAIINVAPYTSYSGNEDERFRASFTWTSYDGHSFTSTGTAYFKTEDEAVWECIRQVWMR